MGELIVANLLPELEAAVRSRLDGPELNVVVAGAGPQATGPFLGLSQEQWSAGVAGAKQAFREAQRAALAWVERGEQGRVVFVVSTASVRSVHGAALDAVAGAFLSTIAQVGAVELGGNGVTINVVAHGWLEGRDSERFAEGVPVGRLARPEEVAAAIAFLASPSASYVNGAVLAVDGGFWITKTGGGSPLLS